MTNAVGEIDEAYGKTLKSPRFYADQEVALVCRQYHWQKIGHVEVARVWEVTPSGRLVVSVAGYGLYLFDPGGQRCDTLHGKYLFASLDHLTDELRDEIERRELIARIQITWTHYTKHLSTAELREIAEINRRAEKRQEDHSR
jgi:hypothetical protein